MTVCEEVPDIGGALSVDGAVRTGTRPSGLVTALLTRASMRGEGGSDGLI